MGDSLFAVFLVDRHPLSVLLIPADGRADSPLVLFYHTVHDGAITSVQGMFFKLLRYELMRRVVFADDEGTRRVPVDPVHDPRTQHAVYSGKLPLTVIQNRIDQRTAVMSRRRMHHHLLWFIDNNNVTVFIKYIQGDVLRLHRQFLRRLHYYLYLVTSI